MCVHRTSMSKGVVSLPQQYKKWLCLPDTHTSALHLFFLPLLAENGNYTGTDWRSTARMINGRTHKSSLADVTMLCQCQAGTVRHLLYVECSTCVVSNWIERTQWWWLSRTLYCTYLLWWCGVVWCDLSICLEMIIVSRERNDGHICRWWWGCEWWWWWRWRGNPNTHRNKTVTSHHHTTVLCTYRTDKQQTRKKRKRKRGCEGEWR